MERQENRKLAKKSNNIQCYTYLIKVTFYSILAIILKFLNTERSVVRVF